MASTDSGNFNYFAANRPLASLTLRTGTFDYWRGNRPILFMIIAGGLTYPQLERGLRGYMRGSASEQH